MIPLSPEQQKSMQTWSDKRDALLREVGIFESQLEAIKREVKTKTGTLNDLNSKIGFAEGRLSEIDKTEKRFEESLNAEIVDLTARKSALAEEVKSLEKDIKNKFELRDNVQIDISNAARVQQGIVERTAQMEKVVGNIFSIGEKHLSEIKISTDSAQKIISDLIVKGKENVKTTNIVLEKLPKYIFELSRPMPVRRIPKDEQIKKIK